jgi:hypothetical protein
LHGHASERASVAAIDDRLRRCGLLMAEIWGDGEVRADAAIEISDALEVRVSEFSGGNLFGKQCV